MDRRIGWWQMVLKKKVFVNGASRSIIRPLDPFPNYVPGYSQYAAGKPISPEIDLGILLWSTGDLADDSLEKFFECKEASIRGTYP